MTGSPVADTNHPLGVCSEQPVGMGSVESKYLETGFMLLHLEIFDNFPTKVAEEHDSRVIAKKSDDVIRRMEGWAVNVCTAPPRSKRSFESNNPGIRLVVHYLHQLTRKDQDPRSAMVEVGRNAKPRRVKRFHFKHMETLEWMQIVFPAVNLRISCGTFSSRLG